MLAKAPGSNPLNGASYFVDGPTHGAAAGAIARLVGIDANVPFGHYLPAFPDSESWGTFKQNVAQMLPSHQTVSGQVSLLEKIADQPEAQRFSSAAEGGTPSGLADFANKLFCHNFTADPGTVPIITTDFLHISLGGCPTTRQIDAYMPLFKQRIDAIVAGTGNRPAVYLLEVGAVGDSSCIERDHAMPNWETALRYEVDQFATLPHAVVYVEAGYSDANSPSYTAAVLDEVDIGRIRGFFTNDTHLNWTATEIKWGEQVSRMTHGAHFIVNTAQNGQGPLLNKHPRTQGVEDLCNPAGRGLGPTATTATGSADVDAFLWTEVPGISDGTCSGGPGSGQFWPAYAESLAARANAKLGPADPSKPY
ncbi:MAG TPA: glycoside hydrolase family 6 protein [Solirubrobacteraceae bacterium]|nr:glycoside hydrolase family 6 protein [Solirubrobacteraceae bacterium]